MKVSNYNHDVNLVEIAQRNQARAKQTGNNKEVSFKDTFSKELAKSKEVNFSKHARERLFSRGIALTDEKLTQLSQAMDKAEAKGSRDTLILDNDAAYVASVPNRTIITAFSRANLQEGVFTSIDSAVIM